MLSIPYLTPPHAPITFCLHARIASAVYTVFQKSDAKIQITNYGISYQNYLSS